jgi:hypothetical protein
MPTSYEKPIEISRRPRQRRIEVYSPKLKRRLTLFSWASHDAWLMLEADPAVKVFCERPAYLEGGAGLLIDFWVSRGRHGKFWVLSPTEPEKVAFPKSAHGVSVQILRRADLMAFDRRIENWSQILPYRVSFARYSDGRLQKEIFGRERSATSAAPTGRHGISPRPSASPSSGIWPDSTRFRLITRSPAAI